MGLWALEGYGDLRIYRSMSPNSSLKQILKWTEGIQYPMAVEQRLTSITCTQFMSKVYI